MIVPVAIALLTAPRFGAPPIFCIGGALVVTAVAALGWIDDHRSLSVQTRLVVHICAGALVAFVAVRTGVQPLSIPLPAVVTGLWWMFWTVSAINVVNFMDGIDGIIGLQAVVFGAISVTAAGFQSTPAGILGTALAGASLGFLTLNWAPARIFMGDVGSGTLGAVFALLGISTIQQVGWTVVHAFLPLMPLFTDEVLTMTRRIAEGQPLSEPHRTHVYQRLVQAGWGHARVTLLYGSMSAVCGLWALAHRRSSPLFWLGAATALVAIFSALWLLRLRAEGQIAAKASVAAG